jgi:DNA repair exonuclease SbcCD ATPase subunit
MSFSEGEKKRIDVAILLAFRQIASMKNSAKINLLISDEVDGGLDGVALEKFVSLMTDGIDANVWVISHVLSNTELVNMFESQCQVKKIGDFSTMEIV